VALSYLNLQKIHPWSGGMGELANVPIFHPRDPGLNLDINKKYFLSLFV
jgi:hypothetical protein